MGVINRPHLIATGFAFNDDELKFDPNYPYSGCLICGAVYQTDLDRLGESEFAKAGRTRWSQTHARKHTRLQHMALRNSGRTCTPEAAQRLAAFGVISLTDLVLDDESKSALGESQVKSGNQEVIEEWHTTS